MTNEEIKGVPLGNTQNACSTSTQNTIIKQNEEALESGILNQARRRPLQTDKDPVEMKRP